MAAESMMLQVRSVNRSWRAVGDCVKAARIIGAVVGAGLLLLSACASLEPPKATPTREAPPTGTWTPIPIDTPPPVPTSISSPGLARAIDLEIGGPRSVRVLPGETTVYSLTVLNRGSAPATGIVLTTVLPPGLIPLWTQPAHRVCEREGSTVRCDAGDFREADTITVTLDLSVGWADTLTDGTDLAGVRWGLSEPACAIDRVGPSSYVTCRLESLGPGAETAVGFGVGVDAVASGEFVQTASVGAREADADRSDNHATFTVVVGAKGLALSEPGAGSFASSASDLVLQADGPDKAIAGQPFSYTYTISNRGTLTATGVRFENPVPPATILGHYAPGLPVCRQRDDRFLCTVHDLYSGETITFTLVITGHAGEPMKMDLDPLMPGWPMCTLLKEKPWLHIVTCDLGTLKPGEVAHVQLGLIPTGVNERVMTNTASVSAEEADANPLDNANTATTPVQVSADVLVRSALSGPAVAGETLSYSVAAVNLGPSDADVRLIDTLPVGIRFVSATSSRGDDCRAEREQPTVDTIVCNLGRLSGGETAGVDVVVAVDESLTAVEEIVHFARVTAEQNDPDRGNNELKQVIPVGAEVED